MSVVWIPKHYTLDNFKTVFGPLNFAEVMKNSGILAVTCTVLSVFVCSLAGYGFARFQFRENRLLFLVVILTILIPPQLTGLPNYVLFSSFDFFGLFRAITGHATNLNLLNNMGVMMLMAALGQGLRAGLFIFIFRQYYKGVPNELEQAAVIDGCRLYGDLLPHHAAERVRAHPYLYAVLAGMVLERLLHAFHLPARCADRFQRAGRHAQLAATHSGAGRPRSL